ncbi:peptidoglycan-binding protein LysM [Flavobacterium weaverense]|uniref:Peptidoglycan-binding protein LysM n=2 Tax=Flavobacterium weaverense TaxID=271156 RepID=A0A3L9ZXD7_9FLAO|nr:peptidoglycan-binding protein LysM [Flavobacterium weaverense]RMA75869.1 hypothetical protein BC961_1568 [Flavobacterium weaverense]
MKKQIVIAALALGAFVFGTTNAQAQTGTSSTPVSTAVNIILSDVISIDAGSVATGGFVNFNYSTTADYNTAKNETVANSLKITSSRNFDVKVKAEGANFVNPTHSDVIPVDVLQVKAVTGGTMVGTLNDITLSTADQILVSDATLGAERTLDIDYSISATKAKTVLLGKAPGTYTQNVTYTATAQ